MGVKISSEWVPIRIYWQGNRPMVDWAFLAERRFTDPFFIQTINPCVRRPADVLFRHQTRLEELGEIAALCPRARLAGFIFHMSRCGSTLLSQILATAPENIVLSEPAPIDDILRSHFRRPEITETLRMRWLEWLVGTLAWQRHSEEKDVFIKFDCWHVMFLPLIQRVFPGVPWIFLYREPLEVMASAQQQLGGQMIPGVLEPELFGWDRDMVAHMSLFEYTARVLGKLCEAALIETQAGRGKLVNYQQLPAEIWPALMNHWRLELLPEQAARMLDAARLNAKNPALPFEPDSEAKRKFASTEIRDLTRQWLEPVYQQLETQRITGGFA